MGDKGEGGVKNLQNYADIVCTRPLVCVSNALNLHGKWHVQDDPLSDPRGVLVKNDVIVALDGGHGAVDPHVSLDALLMEPCIKPEGYSRPTIGGHLRSSRAYSVFE